MCPHNGLGLRSCVCMLQTNFIAGLCLQASLFLEAMKGIGEVDTGILGGIHICHLSHVQSNI